MLLSNLITKFEGRANDLVRIDSGYYTAEYFNRGRKILRQLKVQDNVLMQVFQKKDAVICGTEEAAMILGILMGNYVKVSLLPDGSHVKPWETVMTIEGPLHLFMHLESIYLGIIRDSTTVATNMNELVTVANGKPVLYLADRFNGYENQERQGYAARVGGCSGVCTRAGVNGSNDKPIGTMAHAFIAAFNGSVVEASKAFASEYPDIPLIALVDFNNNSVAESVMVADALGDQLHGVRLDTSEKMQDQCFWIDGQPQANADLYGVCPQLVKNVRTALNQAGHDGVQIYVSGGFTANKIRAFEAQNIPVSAYGVGSSVLHGGSDITADVVQPVGKAGREYKPNDRLEELVI